MFNWVTQRLYTDFLSVGSYLQIKMNNTKENYIIIVINVLYFDMILYFRAMESIINYTILFWGSVLFSVSWRQLHIHPETENYWWVKRRQHSIPDTPKIW